MKKQRVLWSMLAASMFVLLLLSGCASVSSASEDPGAASADSEAASEPVGETEPEMEEVEPKDYGVPAEDAAIVNPIAADEASLQQGEETYKASCINCHGEEGRGDGPIAVGLDPKPADYRAEHIKQLSDGELFYIITNGIEGSDMLAGGFFDEEVRWHLVNYVRSFQE